MKKFNVVYRLEDIIVRVKAELSINPNSPVAVGGDAATPYAEVVILT